MVVLDDYDRIADWISEMGSHSIVDAEHLSELEQFGFSVNPATGEIEADGNRIRIPVYTSDQISDQIRARGKGGHVEPTDKMLVNAADVARFMAVFLTGKSPGSNFMGMGFAFDADVRGIREAASK